jgi:hypothetical protein
VRARALDLPLLVFVRPAGSHCPPAEQLDIVLGDSPEVTACCVMVEATGGEDAGPAESAVIARILRRPIRIRPPMLAVATWNLEVLHVQVAHLMCHYDANGNPAQAPSPSDVWGGADIARMVRGVLARAAQDERRLTELAQADTPGTGLERAEVLTALGRADEAVPVALAAAPHLPTLKDGRRILGVLLAADDREPARAFIERLLATHGKEPCIGWVYLDAGPELAPASAEAVEKAAELARDGGKRTLELRLEATRLRMLASHETSEATSAAVRELLGAGEGPLRERPNDHARFLDELARAAIAAGDGELAERLVQQLDREHPDAAEAVIYRHGQLDRLRTRRRAG